MVEALNTKVDKIRKDSNFKWVQQVLNEMDEKQVDDDTQNEKKEDEL